MNFYKYFKRQSLPNRVETDLLDSVTRSEAKTAVEHALEKEHCISASNKRKYTHFAPEARARIAKYAVECGNSANVTGFFQILWEKVPCIFSKSST